MAAPGDNVATALGALSAGQRVPLLSGEGEQVGEVSLLTHVPVFFKVAITELHDYDPVRKWGHKIGSVVARSYRGGEKESLVVPPGMVIHVGNFAPASELVKFWGGFALATNLIVEQYRRRRSPFAPYEFAIAKRKINNGDEIRLSDLRFDGARHELIPPGDNIFIGRAVDDIAERAMLRLGHCCGVAFSLPYDGEMVEVIQKYYRFLKGRFYEIA